MASLKLGAVRGIEIHADASLLIIFALILVSLGAGVFPAWHPQWGPAVVWLTALGAALLFFASLLAHELSHALVGRRQGIRVPRITLFVFGGMAHMESEPGAWRLATVAPGEDGAEALRKLARHATDQLPVVERGKLLGLVRREDLMKWLMLSGDEPLPA